MNDDHARTPDAEPVSIFTHRPELPETSSEMSCPTCGLLLVSVDLEDDETARDPEACMLVLGILHAEALFHQAQEHAVEFLAVTGQLADPALPIEHYLRECGALPKCDMKGCNAVPEFRVGLDLFARIRPHVRIPLTTKLELCGPHGRATEPEHVLTDDGWNRVLDELTRRGAILPNRGLSRVRLDPLA